MPNALLRALVDLRDRQIQKTRIQFNNRLKALDRASDNGAESQQTDVIARWLDVFQALEKNLDRDISDIVEQEAIYEEMAEIKGIGPMLAAKIIAMVDIERDDTPSALWKYAGYGVGKYWQEDGKIVAPESGMKWIKRTELDKFSKECDALTVMETTEGDEKVMVQARISPRPNWELVEVRDRTIEGWLSPYNKRLKTTLYQVSSSFLKCRSPYRAVYDEARSRYELTRPDWTKAHIHNAAMRKMTKMFLSNLWLRWRTLENLPTRQPYAIEYLEHMTNYQPTMFGWGGNDVIFQTERLSG